MGLSPLQRQVSKISYGTLLWQSSSSTRPIGSILGPRRFNFVAQGLGRHARTSPRSPKIRPLSFSQSCINQKDLMKVLPKTQLTSGKCLLFQAPRFLPSWGQRSVRPRKQHGQSCAFRSLSPRPPLLFLARTLLHIRGVKCLNSAVLASDEGTRPFEVGQWYSRILDFGYACEARIFFFQHTLYVT